MTQNIQNNTDKELSAEMSIFEAQSDVESIEADISLYEEKNFDRRADAIDFLGFRVIDYIRELLLRTPHNEKWTRLQFRAEKLKQKLEAIDKCLFQNLLGEITTGEYRGKEFKDIVAYYTDLASIYNAHETGYDNLDVFLNDLFPSGPMPEPTKESEPEMVYYQKTPARVIFEFVEKLSLRKEDVFFDLGSGLGQAAILVNLLAGIPCIGIEFEPAFCVYAEHCAAKLNLPGVTFLNIDARKADYTRGTVFFMYTPFKGVILQEVLESLRKESLLRKIKIITYGPCTAQVALQSWLDFDRRQGDNVYRPVIFSSF